MAVTNLWAIKGKVTNVIRYITNPSKTTKEVEKVLNYIENSDKTEQLMYVTGINCEPEIAATQFMQTKKLWNKEGGRVCYHGYQSFREGEVDADTAHKSLGSGYSLDDCRLRVIRNSIGTMSDSSFRELESVKDQETIKRYQERLERAGYRVIFTFYGMQLSSCKRRRKYREYSPEFRAEIRKIDRVIALQKFCRKNLLDNPEKVEAFRQRRQAEIDRLSQERKDCRKEQKHWEQEGVSVYADIWKQAAEEKTKAIKPLYRDLRMCDKVLSKAPVAREQALKLVSQRSQEEYIRQMQGAQKKRNKGNR